MSLAPLLLTTSSICASVKGIRRRFSAAFSLIAEGKDSSSNTSLILFGAAGAAGGGAAGGGAAGAAGGAGDCLPVILRRVGGAGGLGVCLPVILLRVGAVCFPTNLRLIIY